MNIHHDETYGLTLKQFHVLDGATFSTEYTVWNVKSRRMYNLREIERNEK